MNKSAKWHCGRHTPIKKNQCSGLREVENVFNEER